MLSAYEQFSVSISCIFHDIQRIQRSVMAEYGLKGSHARCIVALSHSPQGVTAGQLSQTYEKDKAAISRTVSELEAMGILRREGRYRASLLLTEKGWTIARKVGQRAQLAVEQAGEGLEEEQRQVFYAVLGRISENLHAICREGLKEE